MPHDRTLAERRPRGRQREFPMKFQVHVTQEQADFIMAEVERCEWPESKVIRNLIEAGIAAREKAGA